jgi:dTDP-4-dehydrorhamnose 3,5-epimerase-like enzyme
MEAIKKIPTSLPGLFVLEPRVFGDERGFFFESYNQQTMAEAGILETFVRIIIRARAATCCAACIIR